ncbi:xanthine dehydrogenase family protein molybdopterin-binding subunit [Roseomonas populi]|uniref:Xanthine dehydrogenase family protein molybdopterin-binding subunit n=1 Tax=Roseomonas populi TaxID=3121582 RepID=A0ABT1X8W5_9PROT|nr:xanthine dehydrogenase family protein molybdopterin-binding subunit [Roseomonas pecuniae]MCR0983838.1 xanthine dehydrogenase family protein molybdopterin-binding subunit [Roseomonas pecuniae]
MPEQPLARSATGIGQSVRRREDQRLLRGQGRYVADMAVPGQAHAAFLRSPHAHARINGLQLDAARGMPGVVAIFTGADQRAAGVGSLPSGWVVRDRDGRPNAEPPHYPLAVDKVRHVGEPLAVVIAETAAEARDAAEAIEVDYAVLEAAADLGTALESAAPRVWDHLPDNLCCDWEIGDAAAVDAAFARAAHRVRLSLVNNRLVPAPMEPRAAVAVHDTAMGTTTLWTTSQNPHTVRGTLCGSVLNIPETDLRVVSPDVGGGFGTKIFLYPEETTLTWAARRLGRAVRWVGDRTESFLTDVQGRDHRTEAELALDADGIFIGLRVVTLANVGAYLTGGATAIPTYYYAPLLAGVYRTPAIWCNVKLTFTNTVSVDAYRGAGRPEASYVLERLVDEAAKVTGIDRVVLRRRNFIGADQFPYPTPLGLEYDSGDHESTLRLALEAADLDGFPARKEEAGRRGRLRGFGISTYVEIAGGTPSRVVGQLGGRGGRSESAQVRVHPSGAVTVFSGAHSHGQGHETTFAQIVADRLGVPYERVRIVQGDTDQVPFGRGTAASRSLVVGGSAIIKAVEKIVAKGKRIAAHRLEASADDIVFEDGIFRVDGTDRGVSFTDVARAAYTPHDYPIDEIEPGLDETAFYDPKNWTYPGGCHVCELEVDPETGEVTLEKVVAVDDLGEIINPMIVHGQIHGGLAQGAGQALLEGCGFDEAGQMLTASFQDYAMPRAHNMPSFTVLTHGTPCEHNPLKAKGCAEVGSVGLPPAVVNALLDALGEVGVRDIAMPATPLRVWQAIQSARNAPSRPA